MKRRGGLMKVSMYLNQLLFCLQNYKVHKISIFFNLFSWVILFTIDNLTKNYFKNWVQSSRWDSNKRIWQIWFVLEKGNDCYGDTETSHQGALASVDFFSKRWRQGVIDDISSDSSSCLNWLSLTGGRSRGQAGAGGMPSLKGGGKSI